MEIQGGQTWRQVMSATRNKCPCSQCITYAICHRSPSVKTLVDKCTIINDYITSRYRAVKVIKVIEPKWYINPQEGEPMLLEGASNIFNYSKQVRKKGKEKNG